MSERFKVGSKVKILNDQVKVKDLQEKRQIWTDDIEQVLGKVGRVVKTDSDGDVIVKFGSNTFSFDPDCCIEASESPLSSVDWRDQTEFCRTGEQPKFAEVQRLLTYLCPVDDGSITLLKAAHSGDVEKVKEIVQRKPELIASDGKTATECLHIATVEGNVEIVKLLVQHGISLNTTTISGNTALHVAIDRKHTDIARVLIDAGTDVETYNYNHRSVIHVAALRGEPVLVLELIQHGCRVNVQDSIGDTPLHDAIAEDKTACAEILLTSPSLDLTITNEKGFNPLHWAVFHGRERIIKRILHRNKNIIDAVTADGLTALTLATLKDNSKIIRILTEQGADVNVKVNHTKRTVLHVAASCCFLETVKALVSLGADVNAVDAENRTPLYLSMNNVDQRKISPNVRRTIVLFLLENGADVNIKDIHGHTALDVCQNRNLKRTVERRLEGGGDDSSEAPSDILLCCECFTREADVKFHPCNHTMMCRECVMRVTSCPLCGAEVAMNQEKITELTNLN